MLIHLDPDSQLPLYAQLVASLRRSIAAGDVGVGEKLPAAGDLAESLDLNKNTVLRAYRQLRDDGLIELRRGRGATVVAGDPAGGNAVEKALDELAELARAGGIPLDRIIAGLNVRGVTR